MYFFSSASISLQKKSKFYKIGKLCLPRSSERPCSADFEEDG